MSTFTPPADNTVSPVALAAQDLPDPLANKLFKYYSGRPRGRNVFYLTNGTVTEDLPSPTYDAFGQPVLTAWDQIDTAWWGGHGAFPVTAAQATALTNAGYTVTP